VSALPCCFAHAIDGIFRKVASILRKVASRFLRLFHPFTSPTLGFFHRIADSAFRFLDPFAGAPQPLFHAAADPFPGPEVLVAEGRVSGCAVNDTALGRAIPLPKHQPAEADGG
jgi:hypothetical protein